MLEGSRSGRCLSRIEVVGSIRNGELIIRVSGPVVIGENMRGCAMYELVRVGHDELVGGESFTSLFISDRGAETSPKARSISLKLPGRWSCQDCNWKCIARLMDRGYSYRSRPSHYPGVRGDFRRYGW